SPYRINEITITAGLPPDVAFTIGRIEVEEEDISPSIEAADAQADLGAESPGAVLDATGLGFVNPDEDGPGDLAEATAESAALEQATGVAVMDPETIRAPEPAGTGG
ncbi:MAG: hypothetical protein ACRDGI_09430, partial [Candidatus Limnocylindrales bacterium]